MRSCSLFAALAFAHAGGVLLSPEALAPFFAGSIYLPLTLMKFIGLPVYAATEGWGWASPSRFGWVAIIVFWGLVWWAVARLVAKVLRRWRRARPGDMNNRKHAT